jgi:hypothetical protein
VKLARGGDEFAGDLPQEDAVLCVDDEVESDLLTYVLHEHVSRIHALPVAWV